MSTAAATLRPAPPPPAPARRLSGAARALPRGVPFGLLAFAALALLAGARFSSLLAHPPLLRVLGIVAATVACGAAIALSPVPGSRVLALLTRLSALALGAYLSLLAAGAPARLLWPWRWGRLAHMVGRGLEALDGLWPYNGGVAPARLAVMLALPAVMIPAVALACWPGARRAGGRRMCALTLLLLLYLIAAMNETQVGWRVQGLLLLALLFLWVWSWRPSRTNAPRAIAWTAALGAGAVLCAGVVQSPAPLLGYRNWNPFGPAYPPTAFNWNQTYGPAPWPSTTETMVDIASRTPHLWRATTLERFDGFAFVRSGAPPASAGDSLYVSPKQRWITRTTVTVRGLSSTQLLGPGQIISASIAGLPAPRLAAIQTDGTVAVAGAAPQSGDHYTVLAYDPQPSAAELRRAPQTLPAGLAPYTELELPVGGRALASTPLSAATAAGIARIEASPYARVYALARRLDAGAPSTFGLVSRIEAFLRRGFTYNTNPPPSRYPLVSFLLGDRLGYCQQFSGAMTLLLRMDGVAARVAAGFLPGSRDPATGLYRVSARDAHAWVEVFFDRLGWVSFDPTPASSLAGNAGAVLKEHSVAGSGSRAPRAAARRPRSASSAAGAKQSEGISGIVAISAIALGALLALLLGAGWLRSAAAVRRGLEGDLDGAVRELLVALRRRGLAPAGGVTLTELEQELQLSFGPRASRYARLLRERRFAAGADPHRPNAGDRRRLRRALCRRAGLRARIGVLAAIAPLAPRLPARPRSGR